MRIKHIKETYTLSGKNIDSISKSIQELLKALKLEKRNMIRVLFSMEEILLRWRDELGEETEVDFSIAPRFGKVFVNLSVKGRECNPLEIDSELNNWSGDFLANLGVMPSYAYKNNQNIITLTLSKPQLNPIIIYIGALALSVAVGLLGLLMPEATRLAIVEQVLNPVYNAFLGMLKAVAIPMVFLGIAGGIYAMGDAAVFGKIGKKMISRFLGISFLITAVCAVALNLVFKLKISSGGADISGFNTVFQMLLDFLPDGLFAPFVEGKALQVIVIAVVIGFALIVLGDKAKYVAKNIEQLNSIGIFADELLAKIIPIFVFTIIVQNIWTNSLEAFAKAWKPVLVYIVLVFAFLFAYVLRVAIKNKVSPALIIKKLFPTFLIAVTTASTSACFGEYASAISNELGVDKKMSSFGSVLGLAFFSPSTAITYIVCAFYVAEVSNIEASISWIIIAIFISFILSVATPTIPGGAIPIYSILFAQLGLPASALAVIITLDVIFDFIATAADKNFIQLELVAQAEGNDCLDINILRR